MNPVIRRGSRPGRDAARLCLALVLCLVAVLPGRLAAQELAPRDYWPAPEGTELFLFAYGLQTGDIITNPALPIVNVDSNINRFIVGAQRTFNLAGRTANFRVELPWAEGTTRAEADGRTGRRRVEGLGDASATLSVNLLGAPTMDVAAFQAFRAAPEPILAASLKIVAPTGFYDERRVINIGANRWAARLRLGYIRPLKPRWLLELSVGTWFFEDNDEFLGATLSQDPITAFDVSLVHRFGPGFWASIDGTYYVGGRTAVAGIGRADLQRNGRLGVSVAYPFHRRLILKGSYSTGVVTRSGTDFRALSLNLVLPFP